MDARSISNTGMRSANAIEADCSFPFFKCERLRKRAAWEQIGCRHVSLRVAQSIPSPKGCDMASHGMGAGVAPGPLAPFFFFVP